MFVDGFQKLLWKIKNPILTTVCPVENPDQSEDSNLSCDSDEDFVLHQPFENSSSDTENSSCDESTDSDQKHSPTQKNKK